MENLFTITENAAKRIAYLISQDNSVGNKLRISVVGGGCSGFKYNYDFVNEIEANDKVFKKDGIEVLIDEISFDSFMQNATLDFIENLGESYFEIKNPNSTARCGCGNSFAA